MSDQSWFLEYNSLLDQVIDQSTINQSTINQSTSGSDVANTNQAEILRPKMKDFLVKVNQYKLITVDKQAQAQQAESFGRQFTDVFIGLSQLYLACEDPALAKGRFDFGAEVKAREAQLSGVERLYRFVDDFYRELVTNHAELPIPYPPGEGIMPVCQ